MGDLGLAEEVAGLVVVGVKGGEEAAGQDSAAEVLAVWVTAADLEVVAVAGLERAGEETEVRVDWGSGVEAMGSEAVAEAAGCQPEEWAMAGEGRVREAAAALGSGEAVVKGSVAKAGGA